MSFDAMARAIKIKTGHPSSKSILLCLANYADENDECFPSVSRIASDTEMSNRTVTTWIKKLEDLGFISVERRFREGRQTSSKYRLQNLQPEEIQTANNAIQTANNVNTDCEICVQNLSLEPITKPITYTFEDFWQIYPRRINKKNAKTKFDAIIKNQEATAEQIINGVKAYAKQVKDTETEFIAHPTTWLNAARWEDEEGIQERSVWDVKMEFWKKGRWVEVWGPKPGEPGCEVPSEYFKGSD